MDQQEASGELSEKEIDREVERRQIELNILEGLNEVLAGGDDETKSDRGYFLDYLDMISHSWQVGESGTVGEVFTRLVARGLLKELPTVAEMGQESEWRTVEVTPADNGKSEIRAVASYRDREKIYIATYHFIVSKEDVEKREREARAEKDEFSNLRYSQSRE